MMLKSLGFFFVSILTTLVFLTIYIQKWNPLAKVTPLKVHFDKSVEGLRKGDDVRVEGILMGKVTDLQLSDNGGVLVSAELSQPVTLHGGVQGDKDKPGYEITVESFTILGGNFISVRRGMPGTPEVDLKATLHGRTKPSAFDMIGETFTRNREKFDALITNMGDTFKELKEIGRSINEGQGTVGKLIKERELHDKAVATLEEAKGAIADARGALAQMREKLDSKDGTIGKLLNTTELHDELTKTLSDVRTRVGDAVDEMKDLAQKAKDPNAGPIGALMSDTQLRDDLKQTATNLKKISQDFEKATDKMVKKESTVGRLLMDDKLYQDAEKALEGVDKILGRAGRSQVHVYGEGRMYPESGVTISRLGIRIWPDDTKYFFGGAAFLSLDADSQNIRFDKQVTAGEDDTLIKFEVGVMYRIPWFFDKHVGIKAGLLEGKPGGGIEFDYELFEGYPIHAEFEIRDAYNDLKDEEFDEEIRGPMTRFWVKAPLWKRGDAWWEQVLHSLKVVAGVSRIQDDPEFFAGIGFEFRDEDVKTLVGLLSAGR